MNKGVHIIGGLESIYGDSEQLWGEPHRGRQNNFYIWGVFRIGDCAVSMNMETMRSFVTWSGKIGW